ncbi:tyrosine-type recombinase/integrase [Microbulbifer spongiae]|uniref:Site-specific integrase n=1 Tax=Microbulbifer spongiae TaxID=2944933 RepID=A0ABY9E7T4_9GAMM|nr:site-specific integrase [Microbulbifer sp. MI-G]WKD49104.1 site-specific integrase [Microbulbifer sp. MI-G]
MAKAWVEKRELELSDPDQWHKQQQRSITVGHVLQAYLNDFIDVGSFRRSKLATIKMLIRRPDIADLDAIHLRRKDVLEYLRRRLKEAKPQTVKNDIMWLSVAFRTIVASREWPIAADEIATAFDVAVRTRMVTRAEKRDRRPTLAELETIIDYCLASRKLTIPIDELVLFAIFSARRMEEITELLWDDLDDERRQIPVRDAKDPVRPVSLWAHLPDEALAVIQRQPRVDRHIFPYLSKSIGGRFGVINKVLGIKDLRFHGLRHEAASYWFERGWPIQRVAQITGHRSWSTLQRYTHLYDFGEVDKYAGWRYRPTLKNCLNAASHS